MISSPWVKRRLLDQFAQRPGTNGISMQYGQPKTADDTKGDDPLYASMITFEPPESAYTVDESCGPGRITYTETYTLPTIIQVLGRTTDTTLEDAENQAANLFYELTRVLQDPTIGFKRDARIERVEVVLDDSVVVSGWIDQTNSKLAATRIEIDLAVQAIITGGNQ